MAGGLRFAGGGARGSRACERVAPLSGVPSFVPATFCAGNPQTVPTLLNGGIAPLRDRLVTRSRLEDMEIFRTLPRPSRAASALAGLLLALSGCGSRQQAPPAADSNAASSTDVTIPADSRGIETIAAQSQPIAVTVNAPARIVPDPARVIHVFPPAGGRLITVTVHAGDLVRKGQVLATLESSDAAGALFDHRKAQADLTLKQKALQRAQDLRDHGAISERDLQQAQADYAGAEADAANAQVNYQRMETLVRGDLMGSFTLENGPDGITATVLFPH